jgi:hypothetical protein
MSWSGPQAGDLPLIHGSSPDGPTPPKAGMPCPRETRGGRPGRIAMSLGCKFVKKEIAMRQQQHDSSATIPSRPSNTGRDSRAERPSYGTPSVFVIGDSRDLLRGSGRHKYDDTGSPGFVVG